MISIREIRTKIKSIQNTQKITKVMEMVAASKMKRAQERMLASRPYTQKISDIIQHLLIGTREYKHMYTVGRSVVKSVGFIVITSDRGLCGGLNVNVLKLLMRQVSLYASKNIKVFFFVVGKKAVSFLERYGYNVVSKKFGLGDVPKLKDFLGILYSALKYFDDGLIDSLYVVYNEFVNTMMQKPLCKQLIPIFENKNIFLHERWDYIYEPDSKELLDKLLLRYIESICYQSVVENIASEQAARMVAMKSATDNAGDLINDFKLIYNKTRQSIITRELSEIVSGADAV